MKFSFLIPSRRRPDCLEKSICSIESKFDKNTDDTYELLVAIDEDDDSYQQSFPNCQFIKFPRHGYAGMHEYYNGLCRVSTGDWLWLWNDDCLMLTEGWNTVVHEFKDRFVVLNPKANLDSPLHSDTHSARNCTFAIIPRKWYDILGYCALNRHVDVYVYVIAKQLGVIVNLNVEMCHDRFDLTGNNNDETFQDSKLERHDFGRLLGNGDQVDQVRSDIEKLKIDLMSNNFIAKILI